MLAIFKLLFEICQFKKNPQDLPSSHFLKYLMIALYVVISLMTATINEPFQDALVLVTVDTGLILVLGYAGLWVRGFTDRQTQTITALLGTGLVFVIITIPLTMWTSHIEENTLNPAALLANLLVFWYLAIIAHIMRHALSIPFWAGIMIAIAYYYIFSGIMRFLAVTGSS